MGDYHSRCRRRVKLSLGSQSRTCKPQQLLSEAFQIDWLRHLHVSEVEGEGKGEEEEERTGKDVNGSGQGREWER